MTIIGFPSRNEIKEEDKFILPSKTLKDWPWDMELGKPHMDINITNPPHYKHLGIECIELTEKMGFCLGNVVKYCYRCNLKGGTDDLRKAKWYLEREISRREGGEPNDAGC